MSDLQCPATLLLVDTDHAAREKLEQDLADLNVAAVYAGSAALHAAAQSLATELSAACSRLPRDSGPQALEEISDLHRGETVVVVANDELLRVVSGREDPTQPVRVLVDADGWLVR
ncbi:MAG: hypothetical protein ACLGIA_06050 [Actinomycetes bacterium]